MWALHPLRDVPIVSVSILRSRCCIPCPLGGTWQSSSLPPLEQRRSFSVSLRDRTCLSRPHVIHPRDFSLLVVAGSGYLVRFVPLLSVEENMSSLQICQSCSRESKLGTI